MASSTFSTPSEDALTRTVDVHVEPTPKSHTSDFLLYYEIDRTVREIEEKDYRRIALQFPGELLHDSVAVYQALKARLNNAYSRDVYVLADTSYGSCCVDEVTAAHVDGDVVVHYGHSCLSRTTRLPAILVFGRKPIDVQACAQSVSGFLKKQSRFFEKPCELILRHEVALTHIATDLHAGLRDELPASFALHYDKPVDHLYPYNTEAKIPEASETSPLNALDTAEVQRTPPSTDAPSRERFYVWIGDESPALTKLLYTSLGSPVFSYSPSTDSVQEQTALTNKMLMTRYAILQHARDADVFGILVGTLGVASYLSLLDHLRTTLKQAQKKFYTVSVGKLNPAKLANFLEIECWVWVSCSESMVDSKEFLRPIITPYELQLALRSEPSWPGNYTLDFDKIIANAAVQDTSLQPSNSGNDDEPQFSLTTGRYRSVRKYDHEDTQTTDDASTAIVQRDGNTSLARIENSAAVQFLHERQYQGLQPRVGQDEISVLEQGRSGIARGYEDDH